MRGFALVFDDGGLVQRTLVGGLIVLNCRETVTLCRCGCGVMAARARDRFSYERNRFRAFAIAVNLDLEFRWRAIADGRGIRMLNCHYRGSAEAVLME